MFYCLFSSVTWFDVGPSAKSVETTWCCNNVIYFVYREENVEGKNLNLQVKIDRERSKRTSENYFSREWFDTKRAQRIFFIPHQHMKILTLHLCKRHAKEHCSSIIVVWIIQRGVKVDLKKESKPLTRAMQRWVDYATSSVKSEKIEALKFPFQYVQNCIITSKDEIFIKVGLSTMINWLARITIKGKFSEKCNQNQWKF